MVPIAEVIGWKFDHQPGMRTADGVIVEFPSGIPSQADQDTWTAEYDAAHPSQERDDRRRIAYVAAGADTDAMIVALWERVVEGRNATSDALEVKRQQVKTDNP